MNPIQQLKLIRDNPGVYKSLPDEVLADILLQLLETKSLFKKAKLEIKDGKDGYTPQAGVDYMSREEQERLINELISRIPTPQDGQKGERGEDGIDGADAEISDEEIQAIIDTVYSALEPLIPTQLTSEEIRDRLELLTDEDRLDKKAVRGIEELEEKINEVASRPQGQGGGGLGKRQVQDLIDTAIGSLDTESTPEFEKVNKNLSSYPYTVSYSGDNISSISYNTGSGTITKTFNYTGSDLTSIVLSGDLPVGLTETTKTLSYSGGNLSGVAYS